MAIPSTAVNIVNFLSLTEAQEIVPGNFLAVQTANGMQIIDWKNVFVLKLDDTGSGSLQGTLSAQSINSTSGIFNVLSAASFISNGKLGITTTADYYNRLTSSNGIITSASYVIGSPEYVDLLTLKIPAASSYAANIGKPVYEVYATNKTVTPPNSSVDLTFTVLPAELAATDFNSTDFTFGYTGTIPITATPFISNIGIDINNQLTATLYFPSVPAATISPITVKVSKHYTV